MNNVEVNEIPRYFDSNDVLAYILGVCEKNDVTWNLTKAQKLLYCCYGAILAVFDEKITDENPQAWEYGPVFPRTFNGLKKRKIIPGEDHGFSKLCNPDWLPLIEQTVKVFGKFNASQLSAWSHKAGSPWDKATNGGKVLLMQIPSEYIKSYFSTLMVPG